MTWNLPAEERDAVLKLSGPERYAYFVKRAADWEEVWGLRDDRGWVTAERDAHTLIPVWPHADYARASALGNWEGADPALIDLDEWVESWLPELEAKGHLVAVFPIPEGNGVAVEPGRVGADLEAEAQLYE